MPEKKNIVITGATSGIGKALCEKFAQENTVFAGYRNEKLVPDLKAISHNVIPFYIDFKHVDSVAFAANFIKVKTEHVDTLINAAGCVVAGAIENIDIKRIREQFEVNTFGHLDFTQRLLPLLDNSKIINISSKSSFGIFPFVSPYCASKRALDIMFNALLLETHKNIKVISVKPGVIATPLWGKSIDDNKDSIESAKGFEVELDYIIENARKNETYGLDVMEVVRVIEEIEKNPNPKSTYTVGWDAKLAECVSKLPQDWVNKIIKKGMEVRFKNAAKIKNKNLENKSEDADNIKTDV